MQYIMVFYHLDIMFRTNGNYLFNSIDLHKGLVPNNKVIPKLYLSIVRKFGFVVMIVSITLTCV